MFINSSGWDDPALSAHFGVASIDWSNDKVDWAVQDPMDCEERMVAQADRLVATNPRTRAWVYRCAGWAGSTGAPGGGLRARVGSCMHARVRT